MDIGGSCKTLVSTDGGAKVDDFVLDSVKVVENQAKVESKKGHDRTSRHSDGGQQDSDGLQEKLGDSEVKKSEKVLDVVLTDKELEALAVLTEPSIVHKEEILDELKLKFKMPKLQVCSKRESNRRRFGLTKTNMRTTTTTRRRRRRQTIRRRFS